jgi:primosomal protein N' (replication factor Y)
LLRITSPDLAAAEHTAQEIAAHLGTHLDEAWALLGPVPAPILRVARRYRWQVLLKGAIAATIPDLTDLAQQCPAHVSLTIDVDPLNLM